MNRNKVIAGARLWGMLAAIGVLLLASGCISYQVREIDTTVAGDFKWTGKVRVTERVTKGLAICGSPSETETTEAIELVGEGGRSVVIRPNDDLRGDAPYVCVQDKGQPPDQVLPVACKKIEAFDHAWHSLLVDAAKDHPDMAEAMGSAPNPDLIGVATQRYFEISQHIAAREFDQVTGAEVAFVCAFNTRQRHTTYEFSDDTIVHVWIDKNDLLTVIVEDAADGVLHCYTAEPLAARLIEPAK
ncbi:MAG: hypothetical protein JXO22_16860 [Phycisphaerae bacterium]|nr:hypothetical protein [Phycisphaerae bacterium]